ncbi:MAG TPA: outer membrane beta-barrel protein [Candidatus Angelobacter sp.]
MGTIPSFAQAPTDNAVSTVSQADEIRELREAVKELRAEVAELKSEIQGGKATDLKVPAASGDSASSSPATPAQATEAQTVKRDGLGLDFLRQATIEVGLDGYYGYNFNNPIGRVNLLRAYDVSSNAFSLSQANLIFKEDPDLTAGRRWGGRLDLQYGQATETLQGRIGNEPRPDVYRPIFQVYGTYIAPLGKGLTIDMGKWASALGIENNYGKDQMNYSRSFWFNFLPFYHMGARVKYQFNDKFGVSYWAVNGTQQTEPFNGFKDQLIGVNIQPHKTVAWTMNYYIGQEHPDVTFFPNGGAPPNSPTEQGLPFQPIPNAADGKLHILDTYLTWQTTPRLTLAAEGDYVIQRLFENSPPAHTTGGAIYARYQATPKVGIAARSEYLSDRGGLFTGVTQAIKEITFTYDYKVADRFLVRTEWRRDFSNQPFFLTDQLGRLSNHQNTATMGMLWWWGNKEESW